MSTFHKLISPAGMSFKIGENMTHKKNIAFNLFLAGAVAALFFFTHTPSVLAAVMSWHSSVSIAPTWSEDFDTPSFRASVDQAAAAKINAVTLIVQLYQSNLYTTDIYSGGNTTSDKALTSAIDYIHSKGMQVMLKLHLDSQSGEWRAFINPSDRATWFRNYQAQLLHYAQIAQTHEVEDFCIGTELIDMSTATANPTNTSYWQTMIAAMRKIYSGKLTYSANWGGPGFTDEKNNVQFWNDLDYIGISAYFELQTDNQVQNLMAAWDSINTQDIKPLSERWAKPIQFTEIGYKSVPNAQQQPWNFSLGGSADLTTQQRAYQALFQYWNSQNFMQGFALWDWKSDPNAGGKNNTDYTPQNKPALSTISAWLGNTATSDPTSIITCDNPGSNTFSGCYYNDQTFTHAALSRTDQTINFDWGNGSPGNSIPPDHFSARWQGNFNFSGGAYTFTTTADDGIKISVDGLTLINQFKDQPATTYTMVQNLSAGTHLVTVEYYENTGNAVAKVNWSLNTPVTTPPANSGGTPIPPSSTGNTFVYKDGYPTLNGNYIDCNGAIDNDSGHHTTNPADQDSAHRIGQNCPPNSFVSTQSQPVTPTPPANPVPPSIPPPPVSNTIAIWWPSDGSAVSGTQPLKAILNGLSITQYDLYWQVDGGGLVKMYVAPTGDHDEAMVDFSPWTWKGNGPYTLNFVAKDLQGNTLAQKSITITVNH